jgi:hypothetical protein
MASSPQPIPIPAAAPELIPEEVFDVCWTGGAVTVGLDELLDDAIKVVAALVIVAELVLEDVVAELVVDVVEVVLDVVAVPTVAVSKSCRWSGIVSPRLASG